MAVKFCKYNSGVVCSNLTPENEKEICGKCGWSPEIDKARKAKLNAEQFIRDANAPVTTFIIAGAVVRGSAADPVTIRCSKSPQGNLVLKLPSGTIVVPGKTVMDAMGSRL